jgi:hypothetical protein
MVLMEMWVAPLGTESSIPREKEHFLYREIVREHGDHRFDIRGAPPSFCGAGELLRVRL